MAGRVRGSLVVEAAAVMARLEVLGLMLERALLGIEAAAVSPARAALLGVAMGLAVSALGLLSFVAVLVILVELFA